MADVLGAKGCCGDWLGWFMLSWTFSRIAIFFALLGGFVAWRHRRDSDGPSGPK